MLPELVESFLEYCNKEETQTVLQSKVLDPAIEFLRKRFQWIFTMFQVLMALVAVQTALLLVLLIRSYTHHGINAC